MFLLLILMHLAMWQGNWIRPFAAVLLQPSSFKDWWLVCPLAQGAAPTPTPFWMSASRASCAAVKRLHEGNAAAVSGQSSGVSSSSDCQKKTAAKRFRGDLGPRPQRNQLEFASASPGGSCGVSSSSDGRQKTAVERLREALHGMVRSEHSQQSHGMPSAPSSWLQGAPCPMESSRCGHPVSLGNDIVQFPFQPLPPQVAIAERVLRACETGSIALLQSPTGTGKSIALLTATSPINSEIVHLHQHCVSGCCGCCRCRRCCWCCCCCCGGCRTATT
jgi:hypothetical protein